MLHEEQRIEEEEIEVQGQMYDNYAHHDESSFDDNELRFHHDERVEVDEYHNYEMRMEEGSCTPYYDHDDVDAEHPHHFDYHLQHHENHIINDEEEIIMVRHLIMLRDFFSKHRRFYV